MLSSRKAYVGPVFWVSTDEVLEPTGVRVRRDVVRHSGSIVVLAVDDSQSEPRILIERQYRHAAGRFLYELSFKRGEGGQLRSLRFGNVGDRTARPSRSF